MIKKLSILCCILLALSACHNPKQDYNLNNTTMNYTLNEVTNNLIMYKIKLNHINNDTIYGTYLNNDNTNNGLFWIQDHTQSNYNEINDKHISDYIINDSTLYYAQIMNETNTIKCEFYKDIPLEDDLLLASMDVKDIKATPKIIPYKDSFLLINLSPSEINVYEYKENQLNIVFTKRYNFNEHLSNLDAQVSEDKLYINMCNGSLLILDLTTYNYEIFNANDNFRSFVATQDYIVLYSSSEEFIYDKNFNLLRKENLNLTNISFCAYSDNNNLILYDGFNESLYYRNTDDNLLYEFNFPKETSLKYYPNEFLVQNKTIYYFVEKTLYKLEVNH